jgi:hypothetical protein
VTVIHWLLDSDPSVRWQVLRDLTGAPPPVVAAERARVAAEGWGARLLALRHPDGQWAAGACFPAAGWPRDDGGQPWTATLPTLDLLRLLGLDPQSSQACETIALVRQNCRWEYDGSRFFDGEVEPCINGRVVAVGAYFGEDVQRVVRRLLDDQLEDGGWNCWAGTGSTRSSFDSTINVLEGLLAYERATGGTPQSAAARRRGEEYLLERSLLRRKTTGEPVKPEYLTFSFPRSGTTTCCEGWSTSGRQAAPRTSGSPRRSRWCARSGNRTAAGRWSTPTPVPCMSASRSQRAGPAAGIPFGRCAYCGGTTTRAAEPPEPSRGPGMPAIAPGCRRSVPVGRAVSTSGASTRCR